MSPRWIFAVPMSLALTGCPEEALDPVPTPSVSAPVDPGEGGAPPVAPPRVRDVFVRNPFGGPFDNLMADGDFELSIVPEGSSGQYGWIAFRQTGAEESILAETGGLCKSGLRCGRVPGQTILFGRGTSAANEAPHRASVWMKAMEPTPEGEEDPCDLADAYVIQCASFDTVERLRPEKQPAADGWCQLTAEVEGARVAYCMYIDVGSSDVLIDNVTLLAAPDLADKSRPPASPLPAGAERDQMKRIGSIVRSRTPFGEARNSIDVEPSRPD